MADKAFTNIKRRDTRAEAMFCHVGETGTPGSPRSDCTCEAPITIDTNIHKASVLRFFRLTANVPNLAEYFDVVNEHLKSAFGDEEVAPIAKAKDLASLKSALMANTRYAKVFMETVLHYTT